MIGASTIATARRRAGLPQAELAERLGVPQSTVARWERGKMEPSLDNVLRAVRACDLDLDLRIVERDPELEALVDAHLALSPAERLAQNNHVVNFVDTARRRMASARRA